MSSAAIFVWRFRVKFTDFLYKFSHLVPMEERKSGARIEGYWENDDNDNDDDDEKIQRLKNMNFTKGYALSVCALSQNRA